jgi:hypothetical protein
MSFADFMLLEKKDHIINKIPNLTDEQKKQVIDYFTKKPNMESKINWNKWKELSYKDFAPLITTPTKTEIKTHKKVRKVGIAGLKEGTDYRIFPLKNDMVVGYVPLTWEASKHIASRHIGGCEGNWCTAYEKTDSYWRDHVAGKKEVLIYLVLKTPEDYKGPLQDTKIAIAVYPDNKNYEIYDVNDHEIDEYGMNDRFPEGSKIDIEDDILSHKDFLDEVRDYIVENTEPAELTDADLAELAEDYATNITSEFRGNEEAIRAARGIIDSEYQGISDYADEQSLSTEDMKEHIQSRFGDWEGGYDEIMKYMEEKHAIDPDDIQNKINALSYSEWAANEGSDLDDKWHSELRERLLELKWKYLYDESYDDMIQRFNDEDYRSFDDIEESNLKKWLEYAYENKHDDFVRFKEDFINDFNGLTKAKLNEQEVDYINNLVKKVESAGYRKVKDQMSLNLDSVGSHRYLNKVLLGS